MNPRPSRLHSRKPTGNGRGWNPVESARFRRHAERAGGLGGGGRSLHPPRHGALLASIEDAAQLVGVRGRVLRNRRWCLSLQDGFAIQQKGLAVFRKLFAGKAVFLWGSIAQDINGDLYSPCLFERGDEVMMNWSWLTGYWDLNFLVFSFGDWKKPEPAHKEAPDEESSVP